MNLITVFFISIALIINAAFIVGATNALSSVIHTKLTGEKNPIEISVLAKVLGFSAVVLIMIFAYLIGMLEEAVSW